MLKDWAIEAALDELRIGKLRLVMPEWDQETPSSPQNQIHEVRGSGQQDNRSHCEVRQTSADVNKLQRSVDPDGRLEIAVRTEPGDASYRCLFDCLSIGALNSEPRLDPSILFAMDWFVRCRDPAS